MDKILYVEIDRIVLFVKREIDEFFVKVNDGMQVIDSSSTSNESKGQMMTFDIPLNDTSSAGLGITLKGKTSIVDGQSIDLGVFVKSILTGGAASRVTNRLFSSSISSNSLLG